MNPAMELHDSDESDSDFCPEKDAGNEVSEEASSECSSCSDGEESSAKKPQKKGTKNNDFSKKQQVKRLKGRKHARAPDEVISSDTDNEDSTTADTERRRSTRQTDLSARLCSKEKDTLGSEEEDKSRSDALWADFLTDVKPKQTDETQKYKAQISSKATTTNGAARAITDDGRDSPKHAGECERKSKSEEKRSATKNAEKVTETEVLDFAGEEVHVEKVVNANSIKGNKATVQRTAAGSSAVRTGLPAVLKRPMAGGSGSSGLGSILNQIGKKKKISVLEKSQLDWKSFKQDEGIMEELQTFNKGKDGYLERQDFLQRTDLRQFEIEKNLRQSSRNN